MREIRFRAWDYTQNKIRIVTDLMSVCDGSWNVSYDGGENYTGDIVLMQYTGLHDKNGKEIYEGDIVACTGEKYIVSWHNQLASWYLKPVNYDGWHGISKSDMSLMYEIIGNLWENPELLGGAV